MPDSRFVYTGRDNLEVMTEARNYNAWLMSEVRRAIPNGPSPAVLDFGAGTGTYAELLKASGTTPDCLELDAESGAGMASRGFQVFEDLDEVPADSYDLIYALNVLEHIEDDGGELGRLRLKLRPGGVLVIYVPAFQALYSTMDEKVGHFRRYRKASLLKLMGAAGYDIVRARYCDPVGFVAAFVFKHLVRGSGELSPASVRFYDRLLFPLSHVLERVSSAVVGKNVLVIARRPKP